MKIKIDESEHFINCGLCGQPIDMRDLSQVFEHEHDDRKPVKKYRSRRVIKLDNPN